jgi:hypothetical protein
MIDNEPTPHNAPYTIRYLVRRKAHRVWVVVSRSTDLESLIQSAEGERERLKAGTVSVFAHGRKVWPKPKGI